MFDARILLVDDEPDILNALKRALRKQSFDVYVASSGDEALNLLEKTPTDIIVSDLNMPGMDGVELLSRVANKYPEIIRIILTAHTDLDMILKSINEGRVWGYLQKPWENDEFIILLNQALKARDDALEKSMLKQTLMRYQSHRKTSFEGFIGESVVMQFVYSAIEKAAPSNASVFITGPSGSGKEVAAQALHRLSKRKNKPFFTINCAAIPSELMESEIFGHVKGAFSGALSHRDGLASLADGGTLFLDELGEMDILLQAKLLRFLQTGEFSKVGSNKIETTNIRFIAATNRDPLEAIQEKKLREDLFYRLNVIGIALPPLKYRENDVIQLAAHFLTEFSEEEDKLFAGFSEKAQHLLLNYDWPGNIRQLRNLVHSCVIMCDGPLIDDKTISQQFKDKKVTLKNIDNTPQTSKPEKSVIEGSASHNQTDNEILPLALVERRAIEHAIEASEDNIVQAASSLGVSPSTLYRKIQQWQT